MPKHDSSKKKDTGQLKDAEKKYQAYIEKRNELNEMARLIREERDMINERRKEIKEKMEKAKAERDKLVLKMKQHRDMRNKLQQQAKELIEAKRKKKGEVFKNLPLRVEELKADFQMLEYKQQTTPMSPAEENELIEKIRQKKAEYEKFKKMLQKQKVIEIDISDKDTAIDALFKKANEEHEKAQKYYNESQKKHEEFMKLVNEFSISINEANKKHKEYIEIKKEAQAIHEKAFEMRSKIISIRGEKKKQRDEAKRLIQEQNLQARKAVFDKKKLDEIAEESLDELKKGKKISLFS
ncbi:MAG: hypothetical protein QHH19_00450 [Candidatus Thermoplasmatota archaeon]|jgi:uncharacterized coiled-coil DUF342 family protein|nr:hypothetical protein [Candidatus Thermoplasmatota archaeon]